MIYEKSDRMALRNTDNFKKTNKIWNDLGLNHAWNIGYLTFLCKQSGAKTFNEWEQFYLKNGELRIQKIKQLPMNIQKILLNRNIYNEGKGYQINSLTKEDKNINTNMGRTLEELMDIASNLHSGLIRQGIKGIFLEPCQNYTYIRVLDETWIGIERELNTKKSLENLLQGYEIKNVPIDVDVKYAVDFEIFKEENLILAVQVKSHKYHTDTRDILLQTKNYNNKKNDEYTKVTGVPVLNIYSGVSGEIYNSEEIDKYI